MKARPLFLVVLFAVTLPLLSCDGGHTGETYILVSTNIKVPYWQSAGAGWARAGSQLKVGYAFTGPDTYDPAAERDALAAAVAKKPDGILISVADPNLIKDGIDNAIAAGIPVVTMDSDSPASKRLFFIGTNNYQAGVAGGTRLAQELKGKGTVVVFTMPSQANLKERLHGYKDALEASPQIKLAHIVDVQGDPRIAFDTTTQYLANDKKEHIDAFVCLEALAGKEVGEVLDRYHVTGKTVVAMDTDPDTLDWIKKGVIAATVAQKPYTMSLVGLEMLDDLYHHKLRSLQQNWAQDPFSPLPAFVDTGATLIDKSNVDAFISAQKSATGK